SFMGPADCELRYDIGVDKMMWGNDYPHYEGISPYSPAALRWTFQGVDPAEVQKIVGGNAAQVYGFDLDALTPLANKIGPTVPEIAEPMEAGDLPEDDHCETFAQHRHAMDRAV